MSFNDITFIKRRMSSTQSIRDMCSDAYRLTLASGDSGNSIVKLRPGACLSRPRHQRQRMVAPEVAALMINVPLAAES